MKSFKIYTTVTSEDGRKGTFSGRTEPRESREQAQKEIREGLKERGFTAGEIFLAED